MPLQRADDAYDSSDRFSGVLFPMTDGKSRIVYRVSYEALQDRASADGGVATSDAVETFLKLRSRIEQIASEKYDAGNAERVVTTAELTPLPATPAVQIPPGTVPEAGTAPTSSVKVVSDSGLPFGTNTAVPPLAGVGKIEVHSEIIKAPVELPAADDLVVGAATFRRGLAANIIDNRRAAQALLEATQAAIAGLRDKRSNDPAVGELIDFLDWLAMGLSELVENLDRAIAEPASEPMFLGTAGKIADQLHLGLIEAAEKHRVHVIEIGACIGTACFLHWLSGESLAQLLSTLFGVKK